MIQERDSDVEVKHIYIKKFKYNNPEIAESMCGHPISNRVYKSIFNINTKHHRLLLPDGVVMGFDVLNGSNPDAEYDLIEITLDNILDFDIQETDLDLMLKEDQSPTFEIIGLEKLQEALNQQGMDEVDFSQRASEAVLGLFHANPLKAEILVDLANYLSDADLDSYEDIANHIRHHPTSGKGLNIAQALRALDSYNDDSRRTGEDMEDLFVALEAIVTEMERKIENGLID